MSFAKWTRENKKAVNTASSSNKAKTKGSFADWTERKTSEKSVQDWAKKSENLIKEVQSKYSQYSSGKQAEYDRESYINRTANLLSVADMWKERYAKSPDAVSYIDAVVSNLKKTQEGVNGLTDFYSQFKDENEYNTYMNEVKLQDKVKKLDVNQAEAEIRALEKQLEGVRNKNSNAVNAGTMSIDDAAADIESIEKTLSEKKRERNLAKRYQRSQELSSVAGAADFEEFSRKGANIENPTYSEAHGGIGIGSWYSDAKEIGNIVTFSRENVDDIYNAQVIDRKSQTFGDLVYQYMTDEEVAIYNYYLGKGDKASAEDYLYNLTDELNSRAATAEFDERYKDNTAMEFLFMAEAGLDQVRSGMKAAFSDKDYIPTSQSQYTSNLIYEDLGDVGAKLPDWMGGGSVGQMFYDIGSNTAAQLPSIMVSMIPVVGQFAAMGVTGLNTGGNAYAEMLNLGYDKDQARLYAGMVGASEAGLQYLMGGISALGGKLSGNVITKLVNKVDNAVARTAIKLGGSAVSEFSEEYLQEILTPVYKNIAFNEDNEFKLLSEEALYAGFLGALTAGLLEGGGTVSGEASNYTTGKYLKAAGITGKDLSAIGSTFSADSVAYQLAGRVDENTGAYTLGRMFNEIGATLTEQNVADITRSLESQGVDTNSAGVLADMLAIVVNSNVQLDETRIAALEANDNLSRAIVEEIINPNSTVYQRTLNYNNAMMKLAEEMSGKPKQTEAPENTYTNETINKIEDGSKREYTVSYEGKDINKATNEDIRISKDTPIASTENGEVLLRQEDGSTIKAKDVAFASNDDALVIETIASLGVSTDEANVLYKEFKSPDNNASAMVYARGIEEAYRYGYHNIPDSDMMRNGSFAKDISAVQRTQAYKIGQKAANAKVAKEQAKIDSTVEKQDTKDAKKVESKVYFNRAGRKFTKQQEAALSVLDLISVVTNTDIYVFESYMSKGKRVFKDSDGKVKKAPNGYYNPNDNSIHIDLNAGFDGRGTMLFTLAHELTHKIKRTSPAKYKVLADKVMEAYGKKGVSVDDLVLRQIQKAANERRTLTYEAAHEEVIADSMEGIMSSGRVLELLAEIKKQDKSLWQMIVDFFKEIVNKINKIVEAYSVVSPDSVEGRTIAEMKEFASELEQLYAEALADVGNATIELELGQNEELTNEESFLNSEQAVKCQIRPPYNDGNKAFNEFVDGLNSEARKTFDLFYGFYQKSRITNALSVSGKTVKKVNISSLYLRAQQWNDMLSKDKKWATAAKELAEFLPADIRERMGMHEDGSLSPTPLEEEFKMPSSLAQRLVDSLPFEVIEGEYQLGGKTITLPKGKARQSVGGEAYRRAILNETRKLFAQNKLRKVGIGTMSKDRWGSLGFLAANGKTGASGDFTTICPQMMFNRGCWYCYRRAALESGVNNKLVAQNVWYTGEILRIKDSDIEALNKNGGLRIQSFGDWMPHFSAMLADVLYDAELRGLQVKIITKEPSMINYIAALREQGVGKNLYFNLSADYTIEKAPLKRATDSNSLDAINPERPFMRDEDNTLWWKRAMTVEEAARYREKYDWVNTRIVAADVDEFIRGLKDSKVDVVTGYHGNIREYERVDSTVGEHKLNVEALGDAGMPRFTYNPVTNTWLTEYEGKTQTHKKLAQAIAEEGLQSEYYTKTCCITGRCATCNGKCGVLARDFNVKNATNRDAESVAYWQKHMQYGIEPEFDTQVKYSTRDSEGNTLSEQQQEFFKDSKVRDENGNLKVVYHGTPSGGFTQFKMTDGSHSSLMAQYGAGFYFDTSKKSAERYMKPVNKTSRGGNATLYESYLNIKNPLEITDTSHVVTKEQLAAVVSKGNYEWFFTNGMPHELRNWLNKSKEEIQQMPREEIINAWVDMTATRSQFDSDMLSAMVKAFRGESIIQAMKDVFGKDGIRVNDRYGEVWVAWDANQIKSTTNTSPTSEPDIRYQAREVNGHSVVWTEENILKENTGLPVHQFIANYIAEHIGEVYTIIESGQKVYIGENLPEEYTQSKYTQAVLKKNPNIIKVKNRASKNLGEMIEIADNRRWEKTRHEESKDAKYGMYRYDTRFGFPVLDTRGNAVRANIFSAELVIRNASDGHKYLYDIVNIKKDTASSDWLSKKISSAVAYATGQKGNASGNRVPHPEKPVKESLRETDSVSNRSLLAGALEGVVKNEIEQKRVAEYKAQVDKLDAESQKLKDINAEIKELSFAKGARDTARIKQLRDEATKTANRIHNIDKKLLGLEAAKPLQDVLAREKQKVAARNKQSLEAYKKEAKEKALAKQREIIERNKLSRKKAVEGRHRTEMRHKIQNVVGDLNAFLLKGTKDKHVVIGLQKAVAEALDIVNMDTVGAESRLAVLEKELMAAKTPQKVQEVAKKIENLQKRGDKMNSKLDKLHAAYEEFINSDDPDVANAYDEVISSIIKQTAAEIGETPLRDMSMEQLESVYDMYKAILHRVREANKAFAEEKEAKISNLVLNVMSELSQLPKKKGTTTGIAKTVSKLSWNNEKPVYAFERIGSKTLSRLYENIRKGEDTWAVDVEKAKAFDKATKEKYGYDKWDMNKEYEFTSVTGKTFKLNLEEMMSIYAYAKREKAIGTEHLRKGGFIYDDNAKTRTKNVLGFKMKTIPEDATFHKLNENLIVDIVNTMNKIEGVKGFVDEMQDYLSSEAGADGNEVSMKMYGVKLFKEKFYFPLHVSSDYNARIEAKQKGEVKIKNSGFTKEIQKGASAPIVLTPFMDVWAQHVNEMAMYHAFVLPLEDFYRVYNANSGTSEFLDMEAESVKQKIKAAHTSAATSYIEQFLKDLNGDVRSDPRESTAKGLMSGFKKASVMASLSVVIQQPSSVARALAMLNITDFMYKPTKSPKAIWEEVKKYAPVAIIKEMGAFDTDVGRSTIDYIKNEKNIRNVVDDALSLPPALADRATWSNIWMAVRKEVARKNKDLTIDSEEYLQAVGKRFTEVITKTQVYDSVFSRSANMRSKSVWMQMVTAFMAEPTTSLNMLAHAIRLSKQGYKGMAAKYAGSVYASIVLNSALASIVYAMRDDDEDETLLEKYLQSFTTELVEGVNPITSMPILKDIWSIIQGFTVERTDMSLASDLWSAINAFTTEAEKDTASMDDEELEAHNQAMTDAGLNLAGTISSMFGIPAKNVIREIKAGINTYNVAVSGLEDDATILWDNVMESLKGTVPLLKNDKGKKTDELYDVVVGGNSTYIGRMKATYDDDEKYNNALRTALRDNDPRVKEAAQAKYNGDIALYKSLFREIQNEGNFDYDTIRKAINAEVNSLKPDSETSSKAVSMYDVESVVQAAISGSNSIALEAKEDIVSVAVTNGKTREAAIKSFNSSFGTKVKEKFDEGVISATKAQQLLETIGDNDAEVAANKVAEWQYKLSYPELDGRITYSQYQDWQTVGQPNGVSLEIFTDVAVFRDNGSAGSVKSQEEVAAYIDSITTNIALKDALWCCFYKESTLHKAPWN